MTDQADTLRRLMEERRAISETGVSAVETALRPVMEEKRPERQSSGAIQRVVLAVRSWLERVDIC